MLADKNKFHLIPNPRDEIKVLKAITHTKNLSSMKNSILIKTGILCLFGFMQLNLQAQFTYTLNLSIGAYEPVTSGLIISGPDEGENHWDENAYAVQLQNPFKFPDIDEPYGFAVVGTNGEVYFFGTLPGTPIRVVSPLYTDLIDKRIYGGGGSSEIVFSQEGDITKIEWVDASSYCSLIGSREDEGITFALWLYHSSGHFEFRYGSNDYSASTEFCIVNDNDFLPEISFFDMNENFQFINGYFVSGDPYDPELTEVGSGGIFNERITGLPREGLIYRFVWEESSSVRDLSLQEIELAPNPFNNYIQILNNLDNQIKVFDMNGHCVYAGRNIGSEPIDLNTLVPGMYFMEIKTPDSVFRKKIIKSL
jgi:hypothetical protein